MSTAAAVHSQPHRLVAESDLHALQAVWQTPPEEARTGSVVGNTDDDDGSSRDLARAAQTAVWDMLLHMVHPVDDATYAQYTTAAAATENGSTTSEPTQAEESWEAWVDQSALVRVRELRAQVRQQAALVQAKRSRALQAVGALMAAPAPKAVPQATPLDAGVQANYVQQAQQVEQQIQALVGEMESLQVQLPTAVERLRDNLATVQAEQGQHASSAVEQAILVVGPQSIPREGIENQAPAEERLLKFLMM
jgi:hypothetical protein